MTTAQRVPTKRSHTDGRAWAVAFWVLLSAGVALRIALLFTPAFTVDSDNAIVYLVAKHISEGDIAWFFWGQTYGGTLLEFVAGAAMLVFGAHIEVLSVVATLIFAGVAVLVRQLGTLLFDTRVGTVAGIVFWFSGYYTLKVSISEPGFYGPSLLLGLGVIIVSLRTDARHPVLQWATVGLLAGLAFWQSPMAAALALPAIVILVLRQRRAPGLWKRIVAAALAATVGALPWLIAFSVSLGALSPKGASHFSPRGFVTLFTSTLASTFGAAGGIPSILIALACAALLVLLGVLAVRHRNPGAAALFLGTALASLVIVVGSGVVLSANDTRYSVYLLPALTLSLAYAAVRVRWVPVVVVALAVGLTLTHIAVVKPTLSWTTAGRYGVGDITGLGNYLTSRGVTAVYGDYWIAYSLAAETHEHVTAASLSEPRRYAPYETAAAALDPRVVVVQAGNENDAALKSGTKAVGAFERTEVDGFAIYSFAAPFDPYASLWALY
ncbi:hypothetical protein [Subtercola vilae]|uniref:Glycosyltransferase RgtA/B/C/D-like domain-containing protein n=1 Tax=Subtercola vilae TaxID=2056433 RepID=A0A4T2C1H3_9MICO|nr:hypothetical protein [Subtercola vilae]TIH37807.1 hypothetical protein D4765_07280 [Subtercola vilae]